MSQRQITLTFYLENEVFSSTTTDGLQKLIDEWLHWPRTHISKGDPGKKATSTDAKESLAEALNRWTPSRLGRGSAALYGLDDSVVFYLESARSTLPAESNVISVELFGLQELAGVPIDEWARRFFSAFVSDLPVRYGAAYEDEEFEEKNILTEGGSTRAIGVQLLQAIPGIYWLNYFGQALVRLIGESRLLAIPAYEVRSISGGVLVRLSDRATEWTTKAYREREAAVRSHLADFVFDRHDPDRERIGIQRWK